MVLYGSNWNDNNNNKGDIMKFFNLDTHKRLTANWLKGAWRKIVLTVHPDKGGSHEDYVTAQNEYEELLNRVGTPFHAVDDSPESYSSFDIFLASIHPRVRDQFIRAFDIAGSSVEVCGWWLWSTIPQDCIISDDLEEIGFKWASKKRKYYWAGIPKMSKKNYTMKQIRDVFGSKKLEQEQITA
jgi:curved DNA-binding protein CbpA